MSRAHLLAEGVLASKALTLRFLPGFSDANCAVQKPSLPNHLVWSLGHLAITMHRLAEHIDGRPLPTADFIYGGSLDGGGDTARFASESVAYASKPNPDASHYPHLDRAREIFENAVDRLAAALRNASEEKLDSPVTWGRAIFPVWQLAFRMIFHNGMHAGQITDLRRAMNLGSVI